jgi:hypothetical protein
MKKPIFSILVLSFLLMVTTTFHGLLLADNPHPVNISRSATDSDTPQVGTDGNGAAYVVWFEYQSSRSFYFATNKIGQWSSPQYIEQIVYNAEEAGYPWMDVSTSGVCHLIFQDGRTWVSYDIFHTAYENDSWSSLTNVSNNDGGSCYSGCAVNPINNYAYVVWQDGTGLSSGWNILLRFRSPSGTWGNTQLLPVGGGYMPQITIDAAGTAHLIWTTGWGRTLWYSKNSDPQSSSQWFPPTLIKADVGENWSYAKVACDNAGNAYIIWMDGTAGNDEIFLRKVNSNGTLGPEVNVSQSTASSQEGAIAVDKKNGNILVAWKEINNIYANAFIGGVWTGPGNITKGSAPSKMPSVAVDSLGGAHLAYAAYVSGNWEIMYMRLRYGYYVLTGYGGIHAGGGASTISPPTPYFGFDIAKDLELTPDGTGYYVLDGYGGLHRGGSAPSLSPLAPYWGWDIARDLELTPSGNGYYVLDGYGGVHPGGSASSLSPATPYWGWDIAKALKLTPDGLGCYVLDGYGGVHHGGNAPSLTPATPYWGWNIARALAVIK